jgi:hypothetical protein
MEIVQSALAIQTNAEGTMDIMWASFERVREDLLSPFRIKGDEAHHFKILECRCLRELSRNERTHEPGRLIVHWTQKVENLKTYKYPIPPTQHRFWALLRRS